MIAAVKARLQELKDADPKNNAPVPVVLVTASASGLDPHISPAAADYQINRVAKTRHMKPEVLHTLIEANTE